MKEILLKLANGNHLTEYEAEQTMNTIMAGSASPAQIAAYLTLLQARGETIAELLGSARAMRDHALPLTVQGTIVDTCGTGGDGAGTFNISTAAALVASAGGVSIVKHGNRAASSLAGSADVLAALGVTIDMNPRAAEKCVEEIGICFLFAQAYHPAMKHVAPIRKELGYRTMFNILGPLTNPARPKRQVLGTPNTEIARKMAHVLASLGSEHALVVTSEEGLDEISISGMTYLFEVKDHSVRESTLRPSDVHLSEYPLEGIRGGTPDHNAQIIEAVFAGERGPTRDVVVINAAAAFYVAGKVTTLDDGARLAEKMIDSGAASHKLRELIECSLRLESDVSA